MSHRFNTSILLDMLTYCRPSGSRSESDFIDRFIRPLGATLDRHGNYHLTIGESPILWSCHLDTVHQTGGRQTIHYDKIADTIHLSRRSKLFSHCLGADDTAGVFLCHQMILANMPGHYVFHHAEESGGRGSSDLADLDPSLITSSQFAIAFDRRGHRDVITHQTWCRCCSDVFAESLAKALNNGSAYLDLEPSEHGVFTDTANYTALIGECTNLSVGYDHAHSPNETLDVAFLDELFGAVCALNPADLIAERTPEDDNDLDLVWDYHRPNRWTYHLPNHYRSDEPVPTRITSPEILFTEDCQWCGSHYDPEVSDASDNLTYCSGACEWDANVALEAADRRDTSTYLDPDYADVQRALRRIRV